MITKSTFDKSMVLRDDTVDSGSLATLSSVMHKCAESGKYCGMVYRGAAKVGTFSLTVSESEGEPSGCEDLPRLANIDLAGLDGSLGKATEDCDNRFALRTGGNIIFSAPTGPGGYAVELLRREKGKASVKVFDSRALGSGDLFVAHILRPGIYSIRNIEGKGQAELTVEYPDREKLRMRMEPVLVEISDEGIVPNRIAIQPVQALMFNPKVQSRIMIELMKPDDRPPTVRVPIVTRPKVLRKKEPAVAGQKNVLRKIRFYG